VSMIVPVEAVSPPAALCHWVFATSATKLVMSHDSTHNASSHSWR
jgi:hypothetical protein